MSIKIGIVGAGAIGAVHTQAAKRVGEEIVAIADLNHKAAESLAQREGINRRWAIPRNCWRSRRFRRWSSLCPTSSTRRSRLRR